MGFLSCFGCSKPDEVPSNQSEHPQKKGNSIRSSISRSRESEHRHTSPNTHRHSHRNESKEDLTPNNSLVPTNNHVPEPASLEESFGRQLMITDDTINKQLKRLDTHTDRSFTEEDRWFSS